MLASSCRQPMRVRGQASGLRRSRANRSGRARASKDDRRRLQHLTEAGGSCGLQAVQSGGSVAIARREGGIGSLRDAVFHRRHGAQGRWTDDRRSQALWRRSATRRGRPRSASPSTGKSGAPLGRAPVAVAPLAVAPVGGAPVRVAGVEDAAPGPHPARSSRPTMTPATRPAKTEPPRRLAP